MFGTTTINLRPIGKIGIAIAVVIMVLMIYMFSRELGDIDAGLYGLWRADSDFNDKAGIDCMYMFISPPDGDASNSIGFVGATTKMYMLIKEGGATTFNSTIPAKLRRTSVRLGALHTYNINFGSKVAGLPKELRAEFNPVASMLTLNNGKAVYGRLFKQPEASFFCTTGAQATDETAATDDDPDKKEVDDDDAAPADDE